jgi:hypothetical protein
LQRLADYKKEKKAIKQVLAKRKESNKARPGSEKRL